MGDWLPQSEKQRKTERERERDELPQTDEGERDEPA